MSYSCGHSPLSVKYTLDGAQTGQYQVKLCTDCDGKKDFRFIIKQESLKLIQQELGGG